MLRAVRVLSNRVLRMIAASGRIPWKFRTSLFPFLSKSSPSLFNKGPPSQCKGTREVHVSADDFFNRKQELDSLYSILKSDPRLSVITGPVNSGKSLLLRKVLQGVKERDNTPVLHINLREISFDSVDSLVNTLDRKLESWMEQFSKAAKHYAINLQGYGISFEWKRTEQSLRPIMKLNELFNKISTKLPPRTFWGRHQTPIFIIDEANELQALTADKDGHTALINLFKWLILQTKELHRFHTLLVSSDSFFHLWVASYIGASRYSSYVLGDLTKEEAELFWNQRLLSRVQYRDSKLAALLDFEFPDFEHIYSVCGGNMHLLNHIFWEECITRGKLHPHNFLMVTQEKAKLTKALFADKMPWHRDQLLLIFEELVEAKERFLEYNAVCHTYEKPVVDSLIQNNLLHLRPTKCFSFDLNFQVDGVPVVVPETPCGFIAMKQLLCEFKYKKK